MSYYDKTKKIKNKKEMNYQNNIKEVYLDNFEEEMKKISLLIEKYPNISMDTEFPGFVFTNNIKSKNREFSTYSNIKTNVDRLKLIQIGITLADENGDYPSEYSTWQFNIDFDLKNDTYNPESIHLLINSGINLDILPERGIPPEKFGELFLTSGMVINDNISWITFHGSYDFAYLLKILTAQLLPENVESFIFDLDLYFKNYYDIKFLTQNQEMFRGSLNKIAYDLDIERTGNQHQAGSDSLVTSKVYFKLRDLYYISDDDLQKGKNQIYCLNSTEDTYQEINTNYYGYSQGYNIGGMNPNINVNIVPGINIGYPTYDSNYVYGINNTTYNYYNNNINNINVTLQKCPTPDNQKEKNKNILSNSSSVNTVGIAKKTQKKILKEM